MGRTDRRRAVRPSGRVAAATGRIEQRRSICLNRKDEPSPIESSQVEKLTDAAFARQNDDDALDVR